MPQPPNGQPLCALEEIEDGGAIEHRTAQSPPRFIVVIRRGQSVYAYDNVCPHAGRALNWAPNQFLFTPTGQLVCSAHGATFEVTDGVCVQGPCVGAELKSVAVEVRHGQVWLAS